MQLTIGHQNKNEAFHSCKHAAYDMHVENGTRIKENKTNKRTKSCANYVVLFSCVVCESAAFDQ